MASQKIKKNDIVVILTGKDKGKEGAVLATNYKKQTVIVKGINKKTKHHKPDQENQSGKIEKKEYPIHISNVNYLVKKGVGSQPSIGTKIGFKFDKKTGKKERYMRKVNKTLVG